MRTIRPTRYAHAFDPAEPPMFEVEDGETVIFHADHASAGDLTFQSTAEDLPRTSGRGHSLTGPVAVRGARPGDVLQIEILETRSNDWDWGMIGVKAGQLPERADHWAYRPIRIAPDKCEAYFNKNIIVPTAPFYGVMSVTPTSKTVTYTLGAHMAGTWTARSFAPRPRSTCRCSWKARCFLRATDTPHRAMAKCPRRGSNAASSPSCALLIDGG